MRKVELLAIAMHQYFCFFYFPGKHKIDVTYLGAHIDNSPYEITTYSPKLVHLSKMPLGILGIPFKFRGKHMYNYH